MWSKQQADHKTNGNGNQCNRVNQKWIVGIYVACQWRNQQSRCSPEGFSNAICQSHLRFMHERSHLCHTETAQSAEATEHKISDSKPAKACAFPQKEGICDHTQLPE